MTAIIDFFTSSVDILVSFVQFFVTMVKSIVWLVSNIPQLLASMYGGFAYSPTFIFPFLYASLSIILLMFLVRLL